MSEPLWVDCESCAGTGVVVEHVPLRGGGVFDRELACPRCRSWARVPVSIMCETWRPGRVLNEKAGRVEGSFK